MADHLPLPDAARELGIPPGTLRRWCKEGAPHRPGRRGRGHAVLVLPDAIRAWRGEPGHLALAQELPAVMAAALHGEWLRATGPDKRRNAALVAACWFIATNAALDALRRRDGRIPEAVKVPEIIRQLQKIENFD